MISRLQQLTTARDQLNREIEREEAYLRRIAGIRARVREATAQGDSDVDRRVNLAAETFIVPAQAIYSSDRSKHVVAARHVAMWLLRDAGMSLPAIGATLGRDHTSVLYGVRRVERDGELLAVARGLVEKRSA